MTTESKEIAKAKSPEQQIRTALQAMKPEILSALPKHLDADRLLRISLTEIRTTPKLLQCSMPSLLAAVMRAAQLGLEPGLLGQCYFVPYGTEVTFITGYKGLMKLARRGGNVITIQSDLVYRHDKFRLVRGYEDVLEHVPNYYSDRGEIVGGYAYALAKDGGRHCEFMTLADLNKTRDRSPARNSGPWKTDTNQMYRKTVIRRLCNYLDLEVEAMEAIQQLDENEFGERPISIELNKVMTPTAALNAKLDAARMGKAKAEQEPGEPIPSQPEASKPKSKPKPDPKADEPQGDAELEDALAYRVQGGPWAGTPLSAIGEEEIARLYADPKEREGMTSGDIEALAKAVSLLG